MDKEKLLPLVAKHIDMPGLIADILSEVAKPALQKVVDDSENKFDDVAMAALYPALEPAVNAQVKELWGKLLDQGE